jgi:hypothetical protein
MGRGYDLSETATGRLLDDPVFRRYAKITSPWPTKRPENLDGMDNCKKDEYPE